MYPIDQDLNELTFQRMVEAVPSAVLLVNQKGKIAYINHYAERLFEFGREELIGQGVEILIPERFRKNHPGFVEVFFKSPKARPMGAGQELFAVKKSGDEFPVEIGLNPLVTLSGSMALASIIDISGRKAQEEMRKRTHDLEIRNRELEQVAYIASHDLQEPLRTVSNYITVLEEDYSDILQETAHSYLRSMNRAVDRMNRMIHALLNYSRLGSGRELTNVDPSKLLNEVRDDLKNLIETTGTQLIVGRLPEIVACETEIRQLFQNLISNAIKYHKPDVIPIVNVGTEIRNQKLTFYISDNGIGIAPEYLTRIFFIFQRLHRAEEIEGSGIGLANCKKIVDLHGGEIWVESVVNKGSTFYFTLN